MELLREQIKTRLTYAIDGADITYAVNSMEQLFISLLDTLQREVEGKKKRFSPVEDSNDEIDTLIEGYNTALTDISHLISTMKDTIK